MTDWNADALRRLGTNAGLVGRAYAALTEAMIREGVAEKIARQEARAIAAVVAAMPPEAVEEVGGSCPVCGGPWNPALP